MDAISHLRAAEQDLLERRQAIDDALDAVRVALGSIPDGGGEAPAGSAALASDDWPRPTVPAPKPSTRHRPTIREVLEADMPRDREMHLTEIMALLKTGGVDSDVHSVRGVLHKFVPKGYLEKGSKPATFVLPGPRHHRRGSPLT